MPYTSRITAVTRASRSAVYAACLDPALVAQWMVPDNMRSTIHSFAPREGGTFRISLTYTDGTAGKSAGHSDTFHGRFARLVPDEQIVQVVAFESENAALTTEMTITLNLRDTPAGTELEWLHAGIPDAVSPADNEIGSRMSLGKLVALAEHL